MFQSSPTLSGGCCTRLAAGYPPPRHVSILTHPFGWVLLSAGCRIAILPHVSILTHPFGWVLRGPAPAPRPSRAFQSSPTLSGGCCSGNPAWRGSTHPVSILTHPFGWVLLPRLASQPNRQIAFQSSPTLSGGCCSTPRGIQIPFAEFQSSPTLSGGCCQRVIWVTTSEASVSILTHPFGWVLLGPKGPLGNRGKVSILTHPFGWVLPEPRKRTIAS